MRDSHSLDLGSNPNRSIFYPFAFGNRAARIDSAYCVVCAFFSEVSKFLSVDCGLFRQSDDGLGGNSSRMTSIPLIAAGNPAYTAIIKMTSVTSWGVQPLLSAA